ncbi:uncharacterized protein EHS24_001908 [Apiotrichum porosum]|uniref:Uncharacterized protein n=1 Tax=Apiotrichum porosum TaxID=105984 RepID=A0A427XJL2_9TREE|nr:uncharacterized protein EHS24_001908 [Apiotrichum porosum]RSH78982.1 hypothetical protein EHS24_001908 [Apiotrichum porosum]
MVFSIARHIATQYPHLLWGPAVPCSTVEDTTVAPDISITNSDTDIESLSSCEPSTTMPPLRRRRDKQVSFPAAPLDKGSHYSTSARSSPTAVSSLELDRDLGQNPASETPPPLAHFATIICKHAQHHPQPRATLLVLRAISRSFRDAADAALVHHIVIDEQGVRAPHGWIPRRGWANIPRLVAAVRTVHVLGVPLHLVPNKRPSRRMSIDSDTPPHLPDLVAGVTQDAVVDPRLGVDLAALLASLKPATVFVRAGTALPRPIVGRTLVACLAAGTSPGDDTTPTTARRPKRTMAGTKKKPKPQQKEPSRVPAVWYGTQTVILVFRSGRGAVPVAPFHLPASVRHVVVVFEDGNTTLASGHTRSPPPMPDDDIDMLKAKARLSPMAKALSRLDTALMAATADMSLFFPFPLPPLPLSAFKLRPRSSPLLNDTLASLAPLVATHIHANPKLRYTIVNAWSAQEMGAGTSFGYGEFFGAVVRFGSEAGYWKMGEGVYRVTHTVRDMGMDEYERIKGDVWGWYQGKADTSGGGRKSKDTGPRW